MSKILAIDTATDACSVALNMDGALIELYQDAPKQHVKLILPLIEKLINEAGISIKQLDCISFGCGPAGFTGTRIAAAVVQALAFSTDLPVVPVSTLQGLAQSAYREQNASQILVCLDARMQEVYWGMYQLSSNKIMEAVIPDSLSLPNEVPLPENNHWLGIGDGWEIYNDVLKSRCSGLVSNISAKIASHAKYIAEIALVYWQQNKAVRAEEALPIYLRGAGTWKKISEQ